MGQSELFTGPGTSDRMKRIAEGIPPYDLLKAYREAVAHFQTADVVLVVVPEQADGFTAQPRAVYVERAFRLWTAEQRQHHPLAKESAHQRLALPQERPAFWLVVESPKDGAVGCCAIGCLFRPSPIESSSLS
jgi:hypothetical protein